VGFLRVLRPLRPYCPRGRKQARGHYLARRLIRTDEVSGYIALAWPEKLAGHVGANQQVLSFIDLATEFHLW
jgi:hypothetical protein